MMNEALESVIRYARNKLMAEIAELDDKTEGIACKGLFPVYEQNHSYSVGDVRLHPTTGTPKECMTAYDGSVQPDWTIGHSHAMEAVAQPQTGMCSSVGGPDWSARYVQVRRVHDLDGRKHISVYSRHQFQPGGISAGVGRSVTWVHANLLNDLK